MSKLNYSLVNKTIEKFDTTTTAASQSTYVAPQPTSVAPQPTSVAPQPTTTSIFPLPPAKRSTVAGEIVGWGNRFPVAYIQSKKIFVELAETDDVLFALDNEGKVHAFGSCGSLCNFGKINNVVSIAACRFKLALLIEGGTVRVWDIYRGSEDLGRIIPSWQPPASLNGKKVVAIAGGSYHFVALTDDGKVTIWGTNPNGNTNIDEKLNNNIISISSGFNHNIALKADKTIYGFGSDGFGQLRNIPANLNNVKKIIASKYSTFALKEDGSVVVMDSMHSRPGDWEENPLRNTKFKDIYNSQRGSWIGVTVDNLIYNINTASRSYTEVYDFKKIIRSVQSFNFAAFIVTKNPVGRIQFYNTDKFTFYPEDYPNNITNFAYNYDGFCAVRSDGTVILRVVRNLDYYNYFRDVRNAVDCFANLNNFIILKEDGTIEIAGNTANDIYSIPPELNIDNHKIISVSLCDTHVLALRDDGKVFSWGHRIDEYNTPVPSDLPKISAISTNDGYSLALGENGRVYAWGNNNRHGRMNVSNYTDIQSIATSSAYSLLLDNNGNVIVVADFNNYKIKQIPSNVTDIVDIKAAGNKIVVIKNDGTIISWGDMSVYTEPSNITNAKSFGKSVSLGGIVGVILKTNEPLNTSPITPLALLVDKPKTDSPEPVPVPFPGPAEKSDNMKLKLGLGLGLGLGLPILIIIIILVYFFVIKKRMLINY